MQRSSNIDPVRSHSYLSTPAEKTLRVFGKTMLKTPIPLALTASETPDLLTLMPADGNVCGGYRPLYSLNQDGNMQRPDALQERIREITTLPTLPQVASRLMRTVNSPETSAADVAEIVSRDMSLAARILRLANSAFYGMPRTITNLTNAVVILGTKVINTLVLTVTVFDMFPEDSSNKRLFDRSVFWRHCLGCGVMAKMLSTKINKNLILDAEEAFCAGLLHDIGKVVMEQYLHEDFREALKYGAENKISSAEAERRVLGYTHCDVADWLTEQWELPLVLRFPMLYHHWPEEASEYHDTVVLCNVADALSHVAGEGINDGSASPSGYEENLTALGIDQQSVEKVLDDFPAELDRAGAFLELV